MQRYLPILNIEICISQVWNRRNFSFDLFSLSNQTRSFSSRIYVIQEDFGNIFFYEFRNF